MGEEEILKMKQKVEFLSGTNGGSLSCSGVVTALTQAMGSWGLVTLSLSSWDSFEPSESLLLL